MTSTDIPTGTTVRHTKRWAFVAPIAVAGIAAISFGSAQFTSSQAPSTVSNANTGGASQGIEEYARINGLSGLSPASMAAPWTADAGRLLPCERLDGPVTRKCCCG